MQTLKLTKKYEKYPEYKDSGVEWLGKIPKDWEKNKLKRLFGFQSGDGFPDNLQGRQTGNVPFMKVSDINGVDRYVSSANNYVDLKIVKEKSWHLVPSGSILIPKIGAALSKNHRKVNTIPVCIDNNMLAAIPQNIVKEFGYWIWKMLNMSDFENISSVPSINLNQLRNHSLAIPDAILQKKIAKYLDEKTSYIDRIIESKQKLIELLSEKRTAVINNAVTKGLNSKAELVESGIEWIDMIPKKWKVKKLKFLGEAIIGLTYSPEELVSNGSGTLVLRSSNVQDDKIVLTDNVFVNKTIPKKLITKVGDILICSRNGSRALIGKNALIDDSSAGLSFGAFMTVFRTKNSRFISYFLKSNLFMSQLSTTLTSTINQLTTHYLNNITAIIPPEKEQEEIVDYLDKKVGSYNKAIKHAEDSIEKLREFKSSLISNVVTGKIKV